VAPDVAAPPRSRSGSLLSLVPVLLLAACDFPTEIPQIEQTWVVPTDATSLVVDQLLPPELTVSGGAFRFTPAPVTVSRNLGGPGGMCGACTTSGTAQPKPAFTATVTASITTGSDILSSTLAAGNTFPVTLTHDFNFDPLRPSAAPGSARGYVVTEISTGGTIIGRDSVSGTTTAWPALPQQLSRSIPLTAGAALTSTSPITITVTVFSPAGDNVIMNTSQRMTISSQPLIGVTNVRVRVTNKTVAATNIALDVDDIDEGMVDRIVNGAMLFDITNPFAVSGALTMRITVPGRAPIDKSVALSSAATSTVAVEFTQQELQDILGTSGVNLAMSGTVSGPPAGVGPITPGQALGFANRIRMTIRIGGDS
jgi:hypothetical protein